MKLTRSLFFFLLLPSAALAQVTLQVDPTTPAPALVTAGSSFSLNLQLNNQGTVGVAAYDVDVESLVYNLASSSFVVVSNAIKLTNVTETSPVLNDPDSTLPTPSSPVTLDPQAGTSSQPLDFGAASSVFGATVGTGISPLETVAFQLAPTAAPGNYELEFYAINGNSPGPVTISDNDGDAIGTATTPFFSNSFVVIAAPEPPVVLLLAAAAAVLGSVQLVRRRLTA